MVKKKNFILTYLLLIAFVIGILIAGIVSFYVVHKNDNTIQSGVYIKGINVSGLSKDEAVKLVQENLDLELNDHLILKYKNYEYYVEVEQFDAKFDIEASVDLAYQIGRSGNFFKDMKDFGSVLLSKIDVDPVLQYNQEELLSYLEVIQAQLPDQLEQSSYYVDDDKVMITNGKNGAKIYMDELKKTIIEEVQDITYKNTCIDIPTYTEYPDQINVQAIHDDVYREMQNAYFTTEPRMVYAEVTGVDFNVGAVEQAISGNPNVDEYAVELTFTRPEVTVNDLGMDPFPDLLGTYSTKYINNADRTTNLRLAANKINGKVIMPDESFSFNKVVGRRTAAAGYKNAAIFSDGQVTDGLGGGICQITSTLYNAVVFANMKITSRRNHMFVPSYVTGGRDATVVYGSTDFTFQNSRSYPIKLVATVEGGRATVNVYGYRNENDPEYDISIETNLIKTTAKSLVYDAYKIYKQNGEVVNREKMSRDTYKKY